MAETRLTINYLMFLIVFSFFISGFSIEEDKLNISDFALVTNTISLLNEYSGFFINVIKVVLIPFLVMDILFLILGSFVITFSTLPIIISSLLFTPLGAFATIEYIIPMIRGN